MFNIFALLVLYNTNFVNKFKLKEINKRQIEKFNTKI
jgi:hypothetical protein